MAVQIGDRPQTIPQQSPKRVRIAARAVRVIPRHAARPLPHPRIAVSRPNIALAGIQLLLGYEWLVSGVDKLLLGTFPSQLSQLIQGQVSGGKLPGPFAWLLDTIVLPNAGFFGYVVELAEAFAGLGLIVAGLLALLRPLAERRLTRSPFTIYAFGDRLAQRLAPFAAGGAALLGLSFYLLDGVPSLWFSPGVAYGGAIDTGFFLAVASIILILAQLTRRPIVR